MNIFDKRPLALILCVFVGAFVVFSLSDSVWRYILPLSALIVALVATVLLVFRSNRKQKLFVAIVSIILIIITTFSNAYFNNYFKAEKRYTSDVEIVAIVEEIEKYDYSCSLSLLCSSINGESEHYRIVAEIDSDLITQISRGDEISFSGKLCDFDDNNDYFYSDGYSAKVSVSDFTLLSRNNTTASMLFSDLREFLYRRACMQSDSTSGSVVSALLLGERGKLNGETTASFRFLGITHLLALSGLHLAILTGGVGKFLLAFGFGKKSRSIATILFTLTYMSITGFSPSVVRAGVMLIISSVLYLLSRTHDSVTSLVIAVTVIIAVTPYSVYDLSLWLSAFATLGIIMLSELRIFKEPARNIAVGFFRWVLLSVLASLFAMISILPFTVVEFGYISWISPIATIIFSILCETIMYVGSIMLIIGDFVPIGIVLSPLTSLLLYLSSQIADIPGLMLSTTSLASGISAFITVLLFILFLILKIKHKYAAVSVILVAFVAFICISAFNNHLNRNTENIIYCSTDNADAIVIKSKGKVAVIDSSAFTRSSSYSWRNALENNGILNIENYFATHYTKKLPDAIEVLLSNFKIKNLILPCPKNQNEETLFKELSDLCTRYHVNIKTNEIDIPEQIGEYEYTLKYTAEYGVDSAAAIFTIDEGYDSYLYLSRGLLVGETKSAVAELIKNNTSIILGAHGPKYSATYYLSDEYSHIRQIILSSDNLFFTQKCLKYYEENGCKVYTRPDCVSILNIK